MVPHLVTALDGPLNELEQRMLEATPVIERWFRLEWMEHTPPLYAAVDLRHAGFKLAALDARLHPRGWQNLSPDTLPLAVQAAQAAIEKICPEARNLLVVPENGALSSANLASLGRLQQIFRMAGLNVRFGSIDPALKRSATLSLPGGDDITLEPAQRLNTRLGLKHFDPCTILLNNDLAAGAPGILEDLHEQYLLPPLQAGWQVRRRSRHAKCLDDVSRRFGRLIGVDHWLISAMSAPCALPAGASGWHEGEAAAQLLEATDALLSKIRRKYKEYGLMEKPFVVLKPDQSPTGAWAVRDTRSLQALLQAAPPRGKAAAAKAPGLPATDLLLQEGMRSSERLHDAVAEPVVHAIDRYVVGGYYRLLPEQGEPLPPTGPLPGGAHFVPLAFDGSVQMPGAGASTPNRFYTYGVVGRLALVAASYELEATDPELRGDESP